MHDDIVWDTPQSVYHGSADVLENVFGQFTGLSVELGMDEFVADDAVVDALGALRITDEERDRTYDVRLAHHWELADGFVTSMRAYPDSALLAEALDR